MNAKLSIIKRAVIDEFRCPQAEKAHFKKALAIRNRNRILMISPLILTLSIIISVYLYFNHDLGYPDPLLRNILIMHGGLIFGTTATMIGLGTVKKADIGTFKRDWFITRFFLWSGLLWTMIFSLQSQLYSDQITVFQVGIGAIAIIALIPPLTALGMYGSVCLAFIFLIPQFQTDSYLATSHQLNAVYLLVLAQFASSIFYRSFRNDYLMQKQITRQNQELLDLNKQLEELSQRDALTGIHNRRFFDKQVSQLWSDNSRRNHEMAIAIMDIDNFKSYNDHYGHLEGDTVLKKVVETIQLHIKRPADTLARFGGEEFVLLLPNTDEQGALTLCEKIRASIEALTIRHEHSLCGALTISIGICAIKPELEENFLSSIRNADYALYEAKKQGKNKVIAHSQGKFETPPMLGESDDPTDVGQA